MSAEHIRIPIGGIQLIDPQGVVHDRAEYLEALGEPEGTATDQEKAEARAEAAIEGATVRLQRWVENGSCPGITGIYTGWCNVLSGDPGISPKVNPQVTGSNGLYQWDVSAGTYRVKVTKPGYRPVDSEAANIPPPKLDLHIPMDRILPPQANFSASPATPASQQNVTFTSTSTDPDGTVASQAWDLDNDGSFDDGTGLTAQRSFAKKGTYTVKLRATDAEGDQDVATKTITVSNQAAERVVHAGAGRPEGR